MLVRGMEVRSVKSGEGYEVLNLPGVHEEVSCILRFLLSSLSGKIMSAGRIVLDVAD